MRTKRMATIFVAPNPGLKPTKLESQNFGVVKEEIEGLIKVYKDGYVERPEIVPCVSSALPPELGVISRDIVIDKSINIWARFYVPTTSQQKVLGNYKLPLLVYFHGGGFCVGSAAWSCYHEFLAKLAAKSSCLIMSVNYRLAPENPLPAAYEDGFKALSWLKQTALSVNNNNNYSHHQWWTQHCDFERIVLAGDSAGANIAYNVAARLCLEMKSLRPLLVKGLVLLQPFFGGETRTGSEKYSMVQPQPPRSSALSLAASDTYWRLALPAGANRDHPWCKPLGKVMVVEKEKGGVGIGVGVPMLVCVSEMDILRDRNLEFCSEMGKAGRHVEFEVYRGVGHAFQVLSKSQISQTRCYEMVGRIKNFVSRC
ncbi:probable carboxylesterase 6 [Ziziphus jujuba]|uniref:Probable carboxylesterase 6 n=1 Tax=Ziziphus jujuba TaxID=326968 RepID=A0A6P4B1J1_ZIZJJ|nr:probable carboxylesterase 6 [Ziziphus jujuba]